MKKYIYISAYIVGGCSKNYRWGKSAFNNLLCIKHCAIMPGITHLETVFHAQNIFCIIGCQSVSLCGICICCCRSLLFHLRLLIVQMRKYTAHCQVVIYLDSAICIFKDIRNAFSIFLIWSVWRWSNMHWSTFISV